MTAVEIGVTRNRAGVILAVGVGIVLTIALVAPKVGAIGTGTLIALAVAVVATRVALQGNRQTRLK
jgi:hypothetical protein